MILRSGLSLCRTRPAPRLLARPRFFYLSQRNSPEFRHASTGNGILANSAATLFCRRRRELQRGGRRRQCRNVLAQEVVGRPELRPFGKALVTGSAVDFCEALFDRLERLEIGVTGRIEDLPGQSQVLPPAGTEDRVQLGRVLDQRAPQGLHLSGEILVGASSAPAAAGGLVCVSSAR